MAFSRGLDLVRSQDGLIRCNSPPLTFSDVLIGTDFVRGKIKLHKQTRLTVLKVSRKSMTESGGLPEVQLESTLCLLRGSALTFTEVYIDLSDVALT